MSTKTIKVNTALFTSHRRSKKPKNKGRLKLDFMHKVRAMQAQREKDSRTAKPAIAPAAQPPIGNEFTKSLQFLDEAAKPMPVSLQTPCEPVAPKSPEMYCVKAAPPYSSLKYDELPTYRQWRSQTRKAPAVTERCLISPAVVPIHPAKRIVRRKTLRLGKRGRVIGVLVQGMKERSKNQQVRGKMKNVDVIEMKSYLREKNLIKGGSRAPNDVIREIYSQSRLAGGVENRAGEVLLHNYSHSV